MREFTEEEIQEEMEWVAQQALIMKIPDKLMKNLIAYAEEHPEDTVLTSEDFFGFEACPYCGSYEWAGGTLSLYPEWITPDDEGTDLDRYVAVCSDCGKRCEEDELKREYYTEYWFVRDYWARKIEEKAFHIIRTEDIPPILGRFDSNQAVYLDTVFRELALDLLKERER